MVPFDGEVKMVNRATDVDRYVVVREQPLMS